MIEGKIKKYLETIRSIILSSNEEDGIQLIDKLSNEQAKVETWILTINKGISTYSSLMVCSLEMGAKDWR